MRVCRVVMVAALVSTSACATVSVRHVTPSSTPEGRLKEEGVFYALPKTVAKVQVKIEKTEKTAAPYLIFAPIFAPGATALCDEPDKCRTVKNSIAYAIAQGAAFTTSGEPDPDHVYLVKISGGGTLDQAMSMAWSDTGLPTSASASVTNRTLDVALAGVKMASSLGSKTFLGTPAPGTDSLKPCPVTVANVDDWVLRGLEKVGDTAARSLARANYCDMKPEARRQYQEGDKPLLERAVQSYNVRVLPFANSRFTLLTEASNVLDPVPLIERLDKIVDAELKKLFLGLSSKTAWEPTFEVRDIKLDPAEAELLQIDKENGPCPKAPLTADSKPMPADFAAAALSCTSSHAPVKLQVVLYPPAGQMFETVKNRVAEPGADKDRSFRYRIPAQVRATVRFDQKEYGSGVFSVAQLGHVVSLPAKRASKTLAYDLAFVEQTGGLRSFKIGSTGIVDAASLQAISDAGGTVLDARNTKRDKDEAAAKEAAAAADELTILTRQHTLLKLKHEICEIQKQYGLACTVQ